MSVGEDIDVRAPARDHESDGPEAADEGTTTKERRTRRRSSREDGAGIARRATCAVTGLPRRATALVRRIVAAIRRHPVRTVRFLGIVVAVVAVAVGVLGYEAHQYSATAQARDEASAKAEDAVVKVLSYNFRTIDQQVSDTAPLLTGKFKDDYASLVRDVVTQPAKDQQVAIHTAVVQDSVVSSSPDQVVLLMFVNQQADSGAKANPVLTGSRLRVTMDHVDGSWLISELTPV
ncbi:hypothetical protein [Pseudonocardia acidicola]|uniref:Mce-associated membrane protein n=1 Tax=Pseudonocardia acidicola TaxID=2724939 RepID=A0ABX1SDC6_9PSEU|nr:hypothetical protein [Pseudonocardia acidicola]NMH98269.1 hypothetical protein [Pseudonocardia acidicola]